MYCVKNHKVLLILIYRYSSRYVCMCVRTYVFICAAKKLATLLNETETYCP